jgi:ribokinase
VNIAVVGSYGVGMTMRVSRVPGPGETVSGGSYAAGPGGKGSNQAIAAARLGAHVSLLTAVGPDALGDEARELWRRERVAADQVVTGAQATMVGFILVDESGENRIAIAPGALDELTAGHVEGFRETIRNADLLIVSMEIPLAAVAAALRTAHEVGTRTLLNPAPAALLPDEAWAWIDVLTPNQSEAPLLLGLDPEHGLSARQLVEALRLRTSATIVLTLGADGCLVCDGDSIEAVAAVPASRVVDTTGAGDSFTAALAVALAEGLPLKAAVQYGSAAGSHSVTIEGVIAALPTSQEIQTLIGQMR